MAERPLRVVFLTWRDSTHPDGGGSEVYVEQVATHLVARGHTVTMLCARHPGSARRESLGGVTVVRTGGRLTVYLRGLAWLALHRHQVDVVVDVINGLPFGAPLVRRRGVVALVHHVHQRQWQIIYPDYRGRIGWFVEHRVTPWLYRRCQHLTVSDASREDLVGIGVPRDQITVAHNGVATLPVNITRSATPRLCVLARLVPHKQIEHAFAVVEQLRVAHPDLHLDVVGDGWWREQLEDDVRHRGLSESVTFHGRVDADLRDTILARAWVMLLPSVKEGWGLAIMEAAIQATPSVAYADAGGVAESVLDGVTGLLARDSADFCRCVERLLTDTNSRTRLGVAAQARAREFDWSSTTDVVERVLQSRQD